MSAVGERGGSGAPGGARGKARGAGSGGRVPLVTSKGANRSQGDIAASQRLLMRSNTHISYHDQGGPPPVSSLVQALQNRSMALRAAFVPDRQTKRLKGLCPTADAYEGSNVDDMEDELVVFAPLHVTKVNERQKSDVATDEDSYPQLGFSVWDCARDWTRFPTLTDKCVQRAHNRVSALQRKLKTEEEEEEEHVLDDDNDSIELHKEDDVNAIADDDHSSKALVGETGALQKAFGVQINRIEEEQRRAEELRDAMKRIRRGDRATVVMSESDEDAVVLPQERDGEAEEDDEEAEEDDDDEEEHVLDVDEMDHNQSTEEVINGDMLNDSSEERRQTAQREQYLLKSYHERLAEREERELNVFARQLFSGALKGRSRGAIRALDSPLSLVGDAQEPLLDPIATRVTSRASNRKSSSSSSTSTKSRKRNREIGVREHANDSETDETSSTSEVDSDEQSRHTQRARMRLELSKMNRSQSIASLHEWSESASSRPVMHMVSDERDRPQKSLSQALMEHRKGTNAQTATSPVSSPLKSSYALRSKRRSRRPDASPRALARQKSRTKLLQRQTSGMLSRHVVFTDSTSDRSCSSSSINRSHNSSNSDSKTDVKSKAPFARFRKKQS